MGKMEIIDTLKETKEIPNIDINQISQNQSIVNIGIFGNVSDGKTTFTHTITGIDTTEQHSSQSLRGISTKLGYANAKIFQCLQCKENQAYSSHPSNCFSVKCPNCSSECKLVLHF